MTSIQKKGDKTIVCKTGKKKIPPKWGDFGVRFSKIEKVFDIFNPLYDWRYRKYTSLSFYLYSLVKLFLFLRFLYYQEYTVSEYQKGGNKDC